MEERIEYRFEKPPRGVKVEKDEIQLLLTARTAQPVAVSSNRGGVRGRGVGGWGWEWLLGIGVG